LFVLLSVHFGAFRVLLSDFFLNSGDSGTVALTWFL
jgi:hypothetical protein